MDRGCTSLLLHFLLSGYGYRKNERLGHFLGRATAFATLTVGGGIVVSLKGHVACNPARDLQSATRARILQTHASQVSFRIHIALGFMVPLVLLSSAGLATQIYLVEGYGRWVMVRARVGVRVSDADLPGRGIRPMGLP